MVKKYAILLNTLFPIQGLHRFPTFHNEYVLLLSFNLGLIDFGRVNLHSRNFRLSRMVVGMKQLYNRLESLSKAGKYVKIQALFNLTIQTDINHYIYPFHTSFLFYEIRKKIPCVYWIQYR